MNSLGKYVLTKTQKIVLLVVVFVSRFAQNVTELRAKRN